ncbi:MAG: flagellar basal body-associated FliL family protein [Gammaproteobacteria bacterium]|nr:flagellar basal body-associated FliL family protein [Gammaproteobacteria bacterium]
MADEEENTTNETKDSGGMMKIILLVNAVLILIGIAVGLTIFLMSGDDENKPTQADTEVLESEGGAEAETETEAKRSGGNPIYVPLNPAFVVNFENQDLVSFLQVDIQVMTYDSAVEQALKVHMPVVRNELLLLLGGKQYHEINTREGKRKLSQDAIKEIRRVLEEAGAPSGIEALYFTSFVMQ